MQASFVFYVGSLHLAVTVFRMHLEYGYKFKKSELLYILSAGNLL